MAPSPQHKPLPCKKPILNPHFESDMADVLKKLVLNGEGIAWLPKRLIGAELADGSLVPAGDKTWDMATRP